MTIDANRLRRLVGMMEASASAPPSKGLVDSYTRIRAEMISALNEDFVDEVERLFPSELSTSGQPWGAQVAEVQAHFAQMSGWLNQLLGKR